MHHVFPVTRDKLPLIDEYMCAKLRAKFHLDEEGHLNHVFCVVPKMFTVFADELFLNSVSPSDDYLYKKLVIKPLDIYICS